MISAANADGSALKAAGLEFSWTKSQPGRKQAEIEGLGERTQLEWIVDSAYRFFPPQRDPLFGFVLHPVDLATNKASAATGRFPGQSPEEMLADITRHSRFTQEEFRVLAVEQPLDIPELHRAIRNMISDAAEFLKSLPSDAVGFVYIENGKPVQPNPKRLSSYERHAGSVGGVWPSSSAISGAMLERYLPPSG